MEVDFNADPDCMTKVQVGDYVWMDRTLYEIYKIDRDKIHLRWSQPLRIRRDVPRVSISPVKQ
jgi:hypothetical protein